MYLVVKRELNFDRQTWHMLFAEKVNAEKEIAAIQRDTMNAEEWKDDDEIFQYELAGDLIREKDHFHLIGVVDAKIHNVPLLDTP